MSDQQRKQFWVDAPLQLQMLAYVLILVTASLLLAAYSVLKGLQDASAASRQIFHSLDWVRQTLREPLLLSATISILVAALVTLLWSHRYAGPLRVLSAAINRLKQGDFQAPVRVRTTDAHQQLVREFAHMQERLRESLETERKKLENLSQRTRDLSESLPKDHPAHHELRLISNGLRSVLKDYRL